MGLEEALRLIENGGVLVDVRSRSSYIKEHIKGAINIPLEEIDSNLDKLPRDKPVIVYCGSVKCNASYLAARKLAALGFGNIYRFVDGLKGWKDKGLPVESG